LIRSAISACFARLRQSRQVLLDPLPVLRGLEISNPALRPIVFGVGQPSLLIEFGRDLRRQRQVPLRERPEEGAGAESLEDAKASARAAP
jgi:hypothetical protein